MSDDLKHRLNLPPIDQIGFVVKDLDDAIARYCPLFGEFTTMDAPNMEWDYCGTQEVSSLRLAFARSGEVEIELIQWLSGKTPHKEFLDQGREGMHHVRFPVENLESRIKDAKALGYRSIWYKRFSDTVAAAYLERPGDPLVIEFFENRPAG